MYAAQRKTNDGSNTFGRIAIVRTTFHFIPLSPETFQVLVECPINGSFTLAMLSAMSLAMSYVTSCFSYLPWPIKMILSVSFHPRWPRQVLFHVAVAGDNDSVIA